MREIKFRAWVKNKKAGHEMFKVVMISWIGEKEIILSGRGGSITLDDCELMQYTGLLDKNGKEIYEGDIVSRNGRLGQIVISEYEIWFFDGLINLSFYPFHKMGVEVIGDIYSNPELLDK